MISNGRPRAFTTLKKALESGPKFSDFISGHISCASEQDSKTVPGDGRLPKWLKTPIPVGERYSNLKDTLRDLKLHTVTNLKQIKLIQT